MAQAQKKAALRESAFKRILDFVYEKAVNGVPGFGTAEELANDYLRRNGNGAVQAVDSLIRWQIAKAGTSGFLTNVGGLLTLPATLPANLTSVLYLQVRLIAAIAYIGGHDLKDDQVKTLVYTCLCGQAATDILKDVGIAIGTKFSATLINRLSREVLVKINRAVGFRLVTKFGQQGVVNLGKAIPIVGGVMGGGFDATTTRVVGKVAKRLFIIP